MFGPVRMVAQIDRDESRGRKKQAGMVSVLLPNPIERGTIAEREFWMNIWSPDNIQGQQVGIAYGEVILHPREQPLAGDTVTEDVPTLLGDDSLIRTPSHAADAINDLESEDGAWLEEVDRVFTSPSPCTGRDLGNEGAMTVDQGVQPADVVVDHLRALLLKPGEHVRGEVVENLFDDAAASGALDVVRAGAKARRLGEVPEQGVARRGMGEAAQRAGQARGHYPDVACERRVRRCVVE